MGWHFYALLAYTVTRRTRELGIRLALGATPQSIVALVVRDAAVLTVLGVTIGIPLSLWPARSFESLLLGLTPADPWTLVTAAVLLVCVACGVCGACGPCRRVAR